MKGWFKVLHGIHKHPLFKERGDRLAIWVWLLSNAAWADTQQDVNGTTVKVPRGCVLTSERRIAKELGLGYQVVRTFMQRLITERMVNAEVVQGRTLISLTNWDRYQLKEEAGNKGGNAALTQEQRTKEEEKDIRDTKVTPVSSVSPSCAKPRARKPAAAPQLFEDFWNTYPHRNGTKKGKARAAQRWASLVKAKVPEQVMLDGAKRYAGDRQVIEGFAKDPATWLNQRGWEDEIEPPRLRLIPGGADEDNPNAMALRVAAKLLAGE